jgi:hypothetical protein
MIVIRFNLSFKICVEATQHVQQAGAEEVDPHKALKAVSAELGGLPLSHAALATKLDRRDPLAAMRDRFLFPLARADDPASGPALYFCGNSLGLQPARARRYVLYELDEWHKRGVEGHFLHSPLTTGDDDDVAEGKKVEPWLTTDENVHARAARLVGALPLEVAIMNGLTVNLHLMMVPFYRPTAQRHKILIEGRSFPSDWVPNPSQPARIPRIPALMCRVVSCRVVYSMRWRRRSGSTATSRARR